MSLISFVQEGHAFKIVCTIAEILCNCSPPLKISACKKREGYIIAAIEGLARVSSAIVMSLCQPLPVIWTYTEPGSIGHWMFLSVLPTGLKDFKNSPPPQVKEKCLSFSKASLRF